MFRRLRTWLANHSQASAQEHPDAEPKEISVEDLPAPRQDSPPPVPQEPDYGPLEAALEAAEAKRFQSAFSLLEQALPGLVRFRYTESLHLAGAALVNAQYGNLGSAGQLAERAAAAYARDCRELTPHEQHFALGAIRRTLALVPVRHLAYGPEIIADRNNALADLKSGQYGWALARLRRASGIAKQRTCLRLHPSKPWESLEKLIHELCDKIEKLPVRTRMEVLKPLQETLPPPQLGPAAT